MNDAFSRVAAEACLLYFDAVRAAHKEATDRPLKEYKPTEPERLAQAFEALLASKNTGIALWGRCSTPWFGASSWATRTTARPFFFCKHS